MASNTHNHIDNLLYTPNTWKPCIEIIRYCMLQFKPSQGSINFNVARIFVWLWSMFRSKSFGLNFYFANVFFSFFLYATKSTQLRTIEINGIIMISLNDWYVIKLAVCGSIFFFFCFCLLCVCMSMFSVLKGVLVLDWKYASYNHQTDDCQSNWPNRANGIRQQSHYHRWIINIRYIFYF